MQTLTVGSGSCTPQRVGLIPNRFDELEKQISVLEDLFGNLVERLQSVRNEEVEKNKKESERPTEAPLSCQVAEDLRQQSVRIRDVCNQIEYQLSVLEL